MARNRDNSEPVELTVGERTVRITHPERVYFPATGATKLDLANYYLSASATASSARCGSGRA